MKHMVAQHFLLNVCTKSYIYIYIFKKKKKKKGKEMKKPGEIL